MNCVGKLEFAQVKKQRF